VHLQNTVAKVEELPGFKSVLCPVQTRYLTLAVLNLNWCLDPGLWIHFCLPDWIWVIL